MGVPEIDVIVAGQIGVGKSTIINMILGNPASARVNNDALPCTTETTTYMTELHGVQLRLWDTQGLNHDEMAGITRLVFLIRGFQYQPELKAICRSRTRQGIPILVWCIPASRIDVPSHWEQFRKAYVNYCEEKARPVVVLTMMTPEFANEWESICVAQLRDLGFGGIPLFPVRAYRRPNSLEYLEDSKVLKELLARIAEGRVDNSTVKFPKSPASGFTIFGNPRQNSRTIDANHEDRPSQPTASEDINPQATLNVAPSMVEQPSNIVHHSSSSITSAIQIAQSGEKLISGESPSSRQAGSKQPSSAPLDLTTYVSKLDDRYLEGGSFGDVYRCRYNSPAGVIEVAVKSFRFHFTLEGVDASHAVKMVRRELGIWRRLDHPNIVPFFGTATGFGMQGSLALVSAWMPNGSLHTFLEKHGERLHVIHQLQLLWDIANGLNYLHSFPGSSIVHGDLNGNNVLVDESFSARLVDFGYSTVVGNIPTALTYLQRSTARPGAIRWSAPELIIAEEDQVLEMTSKSDIYSFGCLGLQVLSGKQPWSEVGKEGAIVARMVKGHKPKRPESRAMDDRHWDFIQRCWSSTDERPTAEVIALDIQEFLTTCPQSPSLRDMLS